MYIHFQTSDDLFDAVLDWEEALVQKGKEDGRAKGVERSFADGEKLVRPSWLFFVPQLLTRFSGFAGRDARLPRR
jgi:hypothetical protein